MHPEEFRRWLIDVRARAGFQVNMGMAQEPKTGCEPTARAMIHGALDVVRETFGAAKAYEVAQQIADEIAGSFLLAADDSAKARKGSKHGRNK